jgi:hypothetical protein
MAREGVLKLNTQVSHEQHTRGQWVALAQIPAAKRQFEQGESDRTSQKLQKKADAKALRVAAREQASAAKLAKKELKPQELVESHQVPVAAIILEPCETLPVARFHCPFCRSPAVPHEVTNITNAGWIFFIVLFLFLCWPLCWLGFLIRETNTFCSTCRMKLA